MHRVQEPGKLRTRGAAERERERSKNIGAMQTTAHRESQDTTDETEIGDVVGVDAGALVDFQQILVIGRLSVTHTHAHFIGKIHTRADMCLK